MGNWFSEECERRRFKGWDIMAKKLRRGGSRGKRLHSTRGIGWDTHGLPHLVIIILPDVKCFQCSARYNARWGDIFLSIYKAARCCANLVHSQTAVSLCRKVWVPWWGQWVSHLYTGYSPNLLFIQWPLHHHSPWPTTTALHCMSLTLWAPRT